MYKWYLKIVLVIVLLVSPSWAGKYVANFLEMGAGARALGMGRAFTAAGDEVTTIWWNPAGLSQINFHQLNLMHSSLYKELYNYNTVAYCQPLLNGTLGFGLLMLSTEDIPFTRDDMFYDWGPDQLPGTNDEGEGNGVRDPGEPIIPVFDYEGETNMAFFTSYAIPLSPRILVGGNFKALRQEIGDYSSSGLGADIGIMYKHSPDLKFGLLLQDITGTYLKWSTDTWESKLPTLRTGVSYTRILPRWGTLNLNGDLETKFENIKTGSVISIGAMSIDPYLGSEFWFKDIFGLRAGLERKYFTTGAGLKISFFEVDYAFLSHEIEKTHRLSVTLNLTKPHVRIEETGSVPVETETQVTVIQKSTTMEFEDVEEEIVEPEVKRIPEQLGEMIGEVKFATGAASLREAAYPTLEIVAGILSEFPEYRLRITGHTDSRSINNEEYPSNYELSLARAQAVADNLQEKYNIAPKKMVIEAFGFEKPRIDNDSPENMAINRRVEIYLIE